MFSNMRDRWSQPSLIDCCAPGTLIVTVVTDLVKLVLATHSREDEQDLRRGDGDPFARRSKQPESLVQTGRTYLHRT